MAAVGYSDHITRFIESSQLTSAQKAEVLLPYQNAVGKINTMKTMSIASLGIGAIGLIFQDKYFTYGGILASAVTYGVVLVGRSLIEARATSYVQSALQARR